MQLNHPYRVLKVSFIGITHPNLKLFIYSSEIDAIIGKTPTGHKPKAFRTYSSTSYNTPRYMKSVSTESGKSHSTLIPMDKLSPLVHEHGGETKREVDEDMVKVVLTDPLDEEEEKCELVFTPQDACVDEEVPLNDKSSENVAPDTRAEPYEKIKINVEAESEKVRKVSFANTPMSNFFAQEDGDTDEQLKELKTRKESCGSDDASLLQDVDVDGDQDMYDDVDDDERELILSEWQKVDAVLRSELFEII